MNTFLKILALLVATAGIVVLVMKFLEADKRRTDDKKHIAQIKQRLTGSIKKTRRNDSDEIADFRDSDSDDDAYLFEDVAFDAPSDDDKYADIFGDDDDSSDDDDSVTVEITISRDSDDDDNSDDAEIVLEGDISEDSLSQLLDS